MLRVTLTQVGHSAVRLCAATDTQRRKCGRAMADVALWDVLLGRCVFGTDIRGQHSAPECVPAVATPSTPAASAIVDDHVSERSVREAASHLLTTGCNQGASLWHHSRDITAEGTSEYSVRERRIHIRMRMPLPSQMLKAWGTRMRGQVR